MLADKGIEYKKNPTFSPFSKQKALNEVKFFKKQSISVNKKASNNKSFSLP